MLQVKRDQSESINEKIDVGSRIKVARDYRGMTQQELADKVGINRTTLTGYESGHRTPDLFTAKRIAAALGVSMDVLSGMDELRDFAFHYDPKRRKEDWDKAKDNHA